MQKQTSFILNAGPLLLVLFIDGMGLGLVFPILNDLIFSPTSNFLSTDNFSTVSYNVLYGVIIGIFMLCWFFGAAILGDLSDQIGRKKSLLICLVGAFLSYMLSAYAVMVHSLTYLIVGRVIAGFTSGSQPIAQAAIIDMSNPDEKTQNIGYILLAISLGFIFGPLFGGLLSNSNIISWFNFATPFYFAAAISFVNIIILEIFFHETFIPRHKVIIKPHRAIEIFISAFTHERIRNLSILFFIYIFGWSSFYSFISLYLLKYFNFDATDVGIYMALMGVGFGIGNGYLANFVSRLYPLQDCFRYFTVLTVLCILVLLLIPKILTHYILIIPLTTAIATSYPCILTLFSDQVDEESQGWVMGITGAIMAFVWAINGVLVGVLAAFDAAYPLYVSAIFLLLSAVLTAKLYQPSLE